MLKISKNKQKQANIYYKKLDDYTLNENKSLKIKITNNIVIAEIENIINLKLGSEILLGVKKYKNKYGVTVYYDNGTCISHYTISHLFCAKESNYKFAEQIVNYIKLL